MTEVGGLRRAEFAVAAFGLTAFLLALVFVVDAVRFHGDVLLAALEALPRGEVHARGTLLIALALFDLVALIRVLGSVSRGVSAHRRLAARIPVLEERTVAGRPVRVVAAARPLAFCAGLLRPRVYVSAGAFEALGDDALAAVVVHESHHAARRDPLRILVARAIGDAYSLGAFSRREQALAELAADAAAVRNGGAAPLAAALLAFHGDSAGIAPERVDRLAGAPRRARCPLTRGRHRHRDRRTGRAAGAGRRGTRAPALLPAARLRSGLDTVRPHRALRGDGPGVARVAPRGRVPRLAGG